MGPRDHAIYFYETPAEKHRTLFPYVEQDLEQRKLVFYLVCDEPLPQLRQRMMAAGIDVKRTELDGSLQIHPSERWHKTAGKLRPCL